MTKVPANVYAVDCDQVAMRYDRTSGHTYFLYDRDQNPGKVFEHILGCIKNHRPASNAANQYIVQR